MTQPVLHIDFETRSAVDLREVGLYNYARHESTDVWCMAYVFGDAGVCLWDAHGNNSIQLKTVHDFVRKGGKVYAHNAPFELAIWNNVMVPRYGWPELKPEQTYCTMALAYAMGLPGNLEDAALAMGLHVLKDSEGRALMLRMCRPRSTKGGKLVWWDDPDKLARLYEYCRQDVRVERELHKRLMPLSDKERKVWLLDYKINQRGVQIDLPSVKAAIHLADTLKVKYDDELAKITNGAATTVTALAPLKEWLNEQGCHQALAGLAKQDVADILAEDNLPPAVRAALTIRQEAGKASNAKFKVMEAQAGEDGRLHNMYQYHGAATGRWAGRAVQTHNLPRNMPKAEVVERVLELVRAGEHDAIDAIYGPPLSVVSSCLRSFFVAKRQHKLISGDYANVEGRGVAWLSGEQWKLDAFRASDEGTGPGIYELAYAKSFNVPVESIKNPSPERQAGKVQELAFGFGGGVGAARKMLPPGMRGTPDSTLDEWKNAWRAAHPRTKATWRDLQTAAISAARNPGTAYSAGHPPRQVKFKAVGSFLWCLLPSGRALCYPYPKILETEYGPQLTYMKVPSMAATGGERIVSDPKNTSNWARVKTYGGSLMENVIQAICRDLLAESMLLLDQNGAAIVLHVHDEVVLEAAAEKAAAARSGLEKIMRTPPEWASGFPLFAEGQIGLRYGKS